MTIDHFSLNHSTRRSAVVAPHCPTPLIDSPKPVLLLGAPGVGKGTQADVLARLWKLPKISTGEILRANVARRTALGIRAKKIMKAGALVPDEVMTEMIADRLEAGDTARGFILDGFPRTIRQAEWLDAYLHVSQQGAVLEVVSLRMDREQLAKRVIHRRVCPLCKAVYNEELMPPVVAGVCDRDGSTLEQRSDDRLEVFIARLDVFSRETDPLIRFYENHEMFVAVDAGQSSALVTQDIIAGLERCHRQMEVRRLKVSYSVRAS
jgi:adenylate kinase